MKKLEQLLKALGNRKRLEILKLLLNKDNSLQNVIDISLAIKLSHKSTSKHLQRLMQVGLLENLQEGPSMYYRIDTKIGNFEKIIFEKIKKG